MHHAVIGYGSLMSRASVGHFRSVKKVEPVIVKGFRRVFDLTIPHHSGDWLNVHASKKHYFNGVLFHVSEYDLRRIKEREDDYDFVSAWALHYDSEKRLAKGLLSVDDWVGLDKGKRLPQKNYFIECRKAAYGLGDDFGREWDETTFLSNGQKVSTWLRKNPSFAKR